MAWLLILGGVAAHAQEPAPEGASGFQARPPVQARRFAAVTAHEQATQAAVAILGQGGTAVDAAIAAQMVLNLVEPQSSGIGGGAFLLLHDVQRGRLHAYDGRETAPAASSPEMFLNRAGEPIPFINAVVGGKSVGVPGTLRMLELAHRRHGRLPWERLFEPAIHLAETGFQVSPRLHGALAAEKHLPLQAAARAYFYDADGAPRPVGHRLRNPEFAAVLKRVAAEGADAIYGGDIARDMVAAVRGHPTNPGALSEADLARYQAKERTPLCARYRSYRLCGMPPPSSGASTVLALLGMLERFDLSQLRPDSAFAVHLFSEAGRLAYADRNRYVADPDFVEVPVQGLLERDYLAARSALIRHHQSMGRANAGVPRVLAAQTARLADDEASELPATSHLSIVDSFGNAAAMTTTIEGGFGSRLMVRGFLLNNEMTDFSFVPSQQGEPVANRIEPGKRPRSSMAPMIVFDGAGRAVMVLGSPGGSQIINYVARTLVALIDWKLPPEAAVALPHFGSRNGPTEIEKGSAAEGLRATLMALGHDVTAADMTSGLHVLQRSATGWVGAVDPRREGRAGGD
jgi:gamma-glutamyltranspeptidase/glutathione hydrolase